MKKFFQEFKAFIARGNVLDMAVGIIVGGAFTAIITALVNGILTPLLQMAGVGSDGFGALQIVLRKASVNAAGAEVPAVVLDFGIVISAIITFLLTALVLFLIVKLVNGLRSKADALKAKEEAKKAEQEAAEAPAPVVEEAAPVKESTEELLAQIRDLLKAGQQDAKEE